MAKGKSFTNSSWMYVIVGSLILISAVMYLLFVNVEYFTQDRADPAKSLPTLEYFYKPECPFCVEFSPIWDEAVNKAKSLKLNVKMVKYDITGDGKARADKFSSHIQGVPTVLYVNGENVTEYDGARSVDAIIAFLKSKQ